MVAMTVARRPHPWVAAVFLRARGRAAPAESIIRRDKRRGFAAGGSGAGGWAWDSPGPFVSSQGRRSLVRRRGPNPEPEARHGAGCRRPRLP